MTARTHLYEGQNPRHFSTKREELVTPKYLYTHNTNTYTHRNTVMELGCSSMVECLPSTGKTIGSGEKCKTTKEISEGKNKITSEVKL